MINEAGATSNSTTTALDGFTGADVGGLPIELVGVGCGDATPDRIIQEVRTLVEQDGAEVVIGPLSGDEGIAVANYAKDHPDVTFIDGIAGAQDTTLQGAGAELLPVPRRRRAVERRARRPPVTTTPAGTRSP